MRRDTDQDEPHAPVEKFIGNHEREPKVTAQIDLFQAHLNLK
jgi:hypothetical protein